MDLFGMTSLGVLQWPGGQTWQRGELSPVDITAHGQTLLVLWEDGLLEERHAELGTVITRQTVPQAP